MGLLDSLMGIFGKNDGGLKDQGMELADRNQDGKVDLADLHDIKNAADVNKDGAVNAEDLASIKDNLGK